MLAFALCFTIMATSTIRRRTLSFRSTNSESSSTWSLSNIFRLAWGTPNRTATTAASPRATSTAGSSSTISDIADDAPVPATTLAVVRVKGDGRCLYRSIARSLASEESRTLSAALETEDADALRDLAYQYVTARDTAADFVRRNVVEGNFKKYTDKMRNPTFFAGEAEIFALANALRIPIAVYLEQNTNSSGTKQLRNIATYGEKFKTKAKGKTIHVLYNGTNHFNALIVKRRS